MIIYTVAIIIELGAEPVPLAPLTSLPLLLAFSKPIKRVKLIVKRKKRLPSPVWPQSKKAQKSSGPPVSSVWVLTGE